jgi:hypothetical protein
MEPHGPSRKRLFIGLITGTCLAVCLFLALLWVVPFVGLTNIHPAAPWVMGAALGALNRIGAVGLPGIGRRWPGALDPLFEAASGRDGQGLFAAD